MYSTLGTVTLPENFRLYALPGPMRRMGQSADGAPGTSLSPTVKSVVAGVAGTGGGVLLGAVVASKLGVDRKKAALVGGGIGLLGALIVSRWL